MDIGWYFGDMNRNEAEGKLLQANVQQGMFIIRKGSKPDAFVLSVRLYDFVTHYLIKVQLGTWAACFYIEGGPPFATLADLVQHYQQDPNGLCTQLARPYPKENHSTTRDQCSETPRDDLVLGGSSDQPENMTAISPSPTLVRQQPTNTSSNTPNDFPLVHQTTTAECVNADHETGANLAAGHGDLLPFHPETLTRSAASTPMYQQPSLTIQVQNLNIKGDGGAVFVGPVTEPLFHLPEEMPAKGTSQPAAQAPNQCREEGPKESCLRSTIQRAGDMTEEVLRKRYKTVDSFVQMMPNVDDDQMHITDIYTQLCIETREGVAVVTEVGHDRMGGKRSTKHRQEGETLNSSEYEKIFEVRTREGDLIRRLILHGMAGLGKSTFFGKIAYDWAVKGSTVLRKYKLVFLLKLCVLDQTSDLISSIFDQLLGKHSGVKEEALELFITENQEKVLILLDGFDELKRATLCEASFGSILTALNRGAYRECCICVSTRTSHLDKLMQKSLIQNPCVHVKVLGFTEEDVHQYVSRFYPNKPNSAKALIKRISDSRTLSQLSTSPILLLLICLLWREHEELPETPASLYSESLDFMFRRKGQISEEDKLKVLTEIGEVALRGLLADGQNLTFEENEFNGNTLALALKVGILNSYRSFKKHVPHNSIQFIHKTIQEYCAAKYWQSQQEPEHGTIKRAFSKIKRKSGKFQTLDLIGSASTDLFQVEYLLRFGCSDNEVLANKILMFIINRHPIPDERLQRLILTCYHEAQFRKPPPQTYINSVVNPSIWVNNENHFLTLVYFLRNVCRSDKRNVHLEHVEHIYFERIVTVSAIAFALISMDNLSSLTIRSCSLSPTNVTTILPPLTTNIHLTTIDLSANETLGGRAAQWAPALKHLTTLKKLVLKQCNVQSHDVEHIASPLSEMTSLAFLDLSYNGSLGGTAGLWAPHLRSLKHLEVLLLCNCSLISQDIEHIAAALMSIVSLTKLDLSCNNALGGLTHVWCPHLGRVDHLRLLVLGYCSFVTQDAINIFSVFWDKTKLTELDLSGNSALGNSVDLWSCYLTNMSNLKKLVMSECSLHWSFFTFSLNFLTNLTDLDISHNSALGGSAKSWSRHLPLIRHLERLCLRDCSLVYKDVEPIAMATSTMTDLSDLDISFNSELSYSVALWFGHLRGMSHLISLDLSGCLSNVGDVKYIASAVCKMTKLVSLNLSFNRVLGGSALSWSPHLRLMKNLSELAMAKCSLLCTDAEHVAESVRHMTSLTKLNLSDNRALAGSAVLWAYYLPRMKHLKTLVLRGCSLRRGQVSSILSSKNLNQMDVVV